MQRHPTYDLWLHTDAELAGLLGSDVLERIDLQAWTLSCVQRLILQDGRRLIYKAQAEEGVEADFYARVSSPLLVGHRCLGRHANTVTLLFDYVAPPPLKDLPLSPAEILAHGHDLVTAVQGLGDGAPLYADLGSLERWEAFVVANLSRLTALIASGKFRSTPPQTVTRLAAWAASPPVRAAFRGRCVFSHADLSGGNVFLTQAGYKIIDWQFPRRLPEGVDLAVYLDFMHLDPYQHVDPAVVNIAWFLRVGWYIHTQVDLFPSSDRYEAFVAANVHRIIEPRAAQSATLPG
jgi:hypothetical protein